MPIALSIDAGFGVTKFTHRSGSGKGSIEFGSFPSVAVPIVRMPAVPEVTRGRRSTVVEYNGNAYSVGPDAHHELAGNMFARDLSGDYYQSDIYHALMRGALSFMNEDRIDVLVLGLPMDRFDYPTLIEALQSHYTGDIRIDGARQVRIEKVVVHPQPFGGYIGLGRHVHEINLAAKGFPQAKLPEIKEAKDLLELSILVVDSGAYTLDWLFMVPSGHVRSASSAANNAGRHRIIRQIYDGIKNDLEEAPPLSLLLDIDQAELLKKSIRIKGRAFDLQEERFQSMIRNATDDSIRQMIEHIGSNIHRVDMIAVVGGEPDHAAAAIRRKLPEIPLFCVPRHGRNPAIFTNLAGFQEYAEQLASLAAQT